MTFLLNQIIFILLNLLNAGNDAIKIREDKKIDHFLNGLAYILAIATFALIFEMSVVEILLFSITCMCNRQLTFDIPLNLLRKLKWDYVSPAPESFIDKWEKKLFGNDGRKPNYIYFAVFVVTIFLNLLFE